MDLTGVGWGARMREWAENIMATKTDEVLAMSCDNVRIIQSKSHDGKRKRCERRYERGGWIKTESLGGGRETVECEGVEKLRNKIEDLVDRIPAMMIECTDATKKNECQEHDIDADGVAVEEAGDGVEFDVSISTSLAGKTAGSIFTTRAGKSAGSISTSRAGKSALIKTGSGMNDMTDSDGKNDKLRLGDSWGEMKRDDTNVSAECKDDMGGGGGNAEIEYIGRMKQVINKKDGLESIELKEKILKNLNEMNNEDELLELEKNAGVQLNKKIGDYKSFSPPPAIQNVMKAWLKKDVANRETLKQIEQRKASPLGKRTPISYRSPKSAIRKIRKVDSSKKVKNMVKSWEKRTKVECETVVQVGLASKADMSINTDSRNGRGGNAQLAPRKLNSMGHWGSHLGRAWV